MYKNKDENIDYFINHVTYAHKQLRKMSKRKVLILMAILVFILAVIYGTGKLIRHFQMEACIKKGGTWNAELNRCESADSVISAPLTDYYWSTAHDSIRNREYLQKGRLLDSITPTVAGLIETLNKRPYECSIEYIGQRNDTLDIRILNDEFLTERMGSTGAFCILGETVYTLTENDSVNFVNIEMNEGSHAGPGTYHRSNFKALEKK